MPRLVFLQSQVSQLDEPIYTRMHELEPDSIAVIYWNDYGFERKSIDPETNIVPDFRQPEYVEYPRYWIGRRYAKISEILYRIEALNPDIVVLSDQPPLLRFRIAAYLRRAGILTALRVDKNHLSERARQGPSLYLEQVLTRRLFDILAPVSPLTTDYYDWPTSKSSLLFPYTTNENKFALSPGRKAELSQLIREKLGIPPDAFVFISATKFSKRESPWELIRSFEMIAKKTNNVHLIALGDGPILKDIINYCDKNLRSYVSFPGFVSFRELQDYFFASDVLLHLVEFGPWEVSPQDALVAGLGIITSQNVGSAQVHLRGPARRFLVPFGQREILTSRMLELATHSDIKYIFEQSIKNVQDFTVDATAKRLLGPV